MMTVHPSTSPLSVGWCHACEVGGTDPVCPQCGGPLTADHPRSAGMIAEGGMHVSR